VTFRRAAALGKDCKAALAHNWTRTFEIRPRTSVPGENNMLGDPDVKDRLGDVPRFAALTRINPDDLKRWRTGLAPVRSNWLDAANAKQNGLSLSTSNNSRAPPRHLRMGDDPKTSVINPINQPHVKNLLPVRWQQLGHFPGRGQPPYHHGAGLPAADRIISIANAATQRLNFSGGGGGGASAFFRPDIGDPFFFRLSRFDTTGVFAEAQGSNPEGTFLWIAHRAPNFPITLSASDSIISRPLSVLVL